jgi:hypothetical protein
MGGRLDRRQRERDDGAAGGAGGQVGERVFALVRWQRMLDEGVELVGVWMVPGLVVLAHG